MNVLALVLARIFYTLRHVETDRSLAQPPALGFGLGLVCAIGGLAAVPAFDAADTAAPAPVLDAAYAGGNILVEKSEGDTFYLKPDLRDTQKGQWWFYWNFRVRQAAGRTLHFRFAGPNPIGVRGPAVNHDGGVTWAWLGAEAVRTVSGGQAREFSHAFGPDAQEVRFGFAIPYLEVDLGRFLARHSREPHLAVETLCQTKKGRKVEALRLGKLEGEPQYRVLLTARHHACESLANYALEGLMEFILTDTDDGRNWRERVEVLAIPFVDKDGVEDGDQGKNRIPHDHNRDYAGQSIYPSVAALRARVPAWSAGRLRFALDLHCPHIRGSYNEQIYLVGKEDPALWVRVQAFAKVLETTQTGPVKYYARDNLPFGTAWNTKANYGGGQSCAAWASELPGMRVATSLELPYANARGQAVTADSARAFGRDLGRAIMRYLATGSD